MISLSDLAKNLKQEKKVAIFCHVRPDGDAIGSACAIKNALISVGVTAEAYCDDYIPDKFSFLAKDQFKSKITDSDYTALIAVDSADIARLGEFSELFARCKNTYNVDHHVSNTRYAKFNYVCDKSANALNIYDLIVELNANIDIHTANLLAMGIMTDTGNFTHQDVGSEALDVASVLVKKGANLNEIYYQTFKKQTQERAKLFGMVMSKLRYFHNGRFVVCAIKDSQIKESGAHPSETEGFVDFIMGIDSVEIGATVMEIDKNKYKISLRSKGANVNAVAGSFGGGGHVLASGCQINGEYEEVLDKLSFAVSRELID